jgi:hypothetical protein
MKKNFLSFVFISLIFTSCKKEKETTEPVMVEETPVEVAEALVDPDTTDTIPAANYIAASTNPKTAELVKSFLQSKFKSDLDKNLIDEFGRKFIQFEFDINEDGQNEIFVGLNGSFFCGSGGCTQYILNPDGSELSFFTVSDYPIIIDTNKSNGYNDLFIYSGGKNRIVKFDGKKYPSNPSVLTELKVLPGDGLPRALNYLKEPYPWYKF